MPGISVGEGKTGRRALDHALPLVPFIDFMVCLIAFLMVTAVWTQLSRIDATARGAGTQAGLAAEPEKELHVVASAQDFELHWQRGSTMLESRRVPRVPVEQAGDLRFPALTDAVTREWQAQGVHRDVRDERRDRAVIHVPNDRPFSEIVAVLDAVHAPRRGTTSAFDVAFASQ